MEKFFHMDCELGGEVTKINYNGCLLSRSSSVGISGKLTSVNPRSPAAARHTVAVRRPVVMGPPSE